MYIMNKAEIAFTAGMGVVNITYKGREKYCIHVQNHDGSYHFTLFTDGEINIDNPDCNDFIYQDSYLYTREEFPGILFLSGYNIMKHGNMREKPVEKHYAFNGNYTINF